MKFYLVLFTVLVLMSCSKDNIVPCFTVVQTKVDAGESIVFTNCTKNAEKYLWQFGDGTSSEEASPSHTFEKPGIYNVSLAIVAPNSMHQLVYSNNIEVRNANQKFDKLYDGEMVVSGTMKGSKGQDSAFTVTNTFIDLQTKVFSEFGRKLVITLPLPYPDKPSFYYTEIMREVEIANNQFNIPDTTINVSRGIPNVPHSYKVTGIVGKYDKGKVIIDYSIDYLILGNSNMKYTVRYTFFK